MEQITKTSDYLQKQFYRIYEKFFVENELVISSPLIIQWGDIINKISNKYQIQQKLPTKIFVGIKRNQTQKITFNQIQIYSHKDNNFKEYKIDELIRKHKLIEDIIQKLFGLNLQGISINCISENDRGYGCDFIGPLFICLSTIFCIQNSIIKQPTDKSNYKSDSSKFSDKEIKQITKVYKKINNMFYGNINQNSCSIQTIIDINEYPQYYKRNESQKDLLKSNCISLDKTPFDYGIISFGEKYDFDKIIKSYIDKNNKDLGYEKNNDLLFQELVINRQKLSKNQYQNSNIQELIKTRSQIGFLNAFVERDFDSISHITQIFNNTKDYTSQSIGLVPTSTTQKLGSFIFILPQGSCRQTMQKIIKILHQSGYNNSFFEYISWIDGHTQDVIQIEQNLFDGIHSKYIEKGKLIFKNTNGKKYIGTFNEIIKNETEGIILDSIYKKIYIKGEGVSHKQILSQSGTIEIISIMMHNIGNYIPNSIFPPSSYSKNKNEMIGKIIVPFKKLIYTHYQKDIPIKCQGNINKFDIILESLSIPIGTIYPLTQNN